MTNIVDVDILWGGYYSYRNKSDNLYHVFRLLDFNKDAFHYALYDVDFKTPPTLEQILEHRPFIQHVPQELEAIMNMADLKLVGVTPLRDEDLFGYRLFLDEPNAHEEAVTEVFSNLKRYNQEPPLQLRLTLRNGDIEILPRA